MVLDYGWSTVFDKPLDECSWQEVRLFLKARSKRKNREETQYRRLLKKREHGYSR